MQDLIFLLVLAGIIGAAVRYLYKQKKKGAKCIGCSVGEGGCSSCGCGCQSNDKD